MRRTLLAVALAAAFAGCGDDNEPETVTVIERTVTAPASEPTATVTVPDPETAEEPPPRAEPPAENRCATAGLDAPGLTALSAIEVKCSEAESVLLNWLQGCGGQDGACEPVPGYSCEQERFAGARSDVTCVKGRSVVAFSFG